MRISTDWQDYGLGRELAIADIRISRAVHYILYLLALLGQITCAILLRIFNAVFSILLPLKGLQLHSGKCCGKSGNRYRTPNYCGTPKTLFQVPWGHDPKKVYRNSQWKYSTDRGEAYRPNGDNAREAPWSHSGPFVYHPERVSAETTQLCCSKQDFGDSFAINNVGANHSVRGFAKASQFAYPKTEFGDSASIKNAGVNCLNCDLTRVSQFNCPEMELHDSTLSRDVGDNRGSAETARFYRPKREFGYSASDESLEERWGVGPRVPVHASDLLKPSVRKGWGRSRVLRRIRSRFRPICSKYVYKVPVFPFEKEH